MENRNEFNAVYKPSSEALFIENFLKESRIKFKTEQPIVDLVNSQVNYRKADFYLPNLKVYVEYFGWYNKSKADRERYDNIVKEYIYNNIPTIFIYPHELGFLEYAFHTKLIKILRLEKFKLRKQLLRYTFQRFWHKSRRSGLGKVVLSLWCIFVLRDIPTGFTIEFHRLIVFVLLIIFFDGLVGTVKELWRYVVKFK